MPAPPAFSVVVTAFNEQDFIGAAIRSVLGQSRSDFELIVVDDGSTDGTAAVVGVFESDPRLRLIRQPNRGLSAARNTGIEAARTERVAFLDSDDVWMPNFLEATGEALDADTDAGFAYTDAWWLDEASDRFHRASAMSIIAEPPADPPRDSENFLRLLVQNNFIFVSTTVRREVLDAVGGFDTSLTACEDYDMWIRILARGYTAAPTGKLLAIKRDRGTSMSQQHVNMLVNLCRVLDATAEEYPVPPDVKEAARSRAGRMRKRIAALEGSDRLRAALLSVRLRLGKAQRSLLRRRIWRQTTPPEVQAAFPGDEWRSSGRPGESPG